MDTTIIILSALIGVLIGCFIGKFLFIFRAQTGTVYVEIDDENKMFRYHFEVDKMTLLSKNRYVLCQILRKNDKFIKK